MVCTFWMTELRLKTFIPGLKQVQARTPTQVFQAVATPFWRTGPPAGPDAKRGSRLCPCQGPRRHHCSQSMKTHNSVLGLPLCVLAQASPPPSPITCGFKQLSPGGGGGGEPQTQASCLPWATACLASHPTSSLAKLI